MERTDEFIVPFGDEDGWDDFFVYPDEYRGPTLPELLQEIRKSFYVPQTVCVGTLRDLFALREGTALDKDGGTMPLIFWREYGYPTEILSSIMRDLTCIVGSFISREIAHWNLDPDCVSILSKRSEIFDEKPYTLIAVLSEEAIEKTTEEPVTVTNTNDMIFGLGRLLFFCVTGGKDPFGVDDGSRPRKISKNNPDLSAVEHIPGAMKKQADLSALEHISEAMDLISKLLDLDADNRGSIDWQQERVLEAIDNPLLWSDLTRFRYLCEASVIINKKGGDLLDSIVSVASAAFRGSIDESSSNHYDKDKVASLFTKIEQDFHSWYHHSEVLHDEGPTREYVRRYIHSYPCLLYEVYKVMREHDVDFLNEFQRQRLL